jgi:hypothetical protein
MVRRHPTLRWLPSDLSPENIAMIQDDASRNNACTKPSEGGIALHDMHLRLWALASESERMVSPLLSQQQYSYR